jgi:O-antigen/teichoic acid export membrane protein
MRHIRPDDADAATGGHPQKSIAGPLPRLACPPGGPDDADAATGGHANQAVHSAGKSTLWAYIQNWAARGISLVVFFTLARLLSPTEFGTFAVAMVFLTLGELFVEQLFTAAIVQRAHLSDMHLNSIFWTTMGSALVFMLSALFSAPWLAAKLNAPDAVALIRALSPIFVLMALSTVFGGKLLRTLNYRALAQRSALSNLISGLVAIAAAIAGCGVWAFVLHQLTFHTVGTFILWRSESWRPRWSFDVQALRELLGFSASMSLTKLLEFVETRVLEMVVGRYMGLVVLGGYSLAARAHQAATQLFAVPLWESSIGIFARQQTDPDALRALLLERTALAAWLISPVFWFAAATAELLIPAVFGAKWVDAVPTFQVLCLVGAVRSIAYMYVVMLHGLGKGRACLSIALVRTLIPLACLPFLLQYSAVGVASSLLIGQLVTIPALLYVLRQILGLRASELVQKIALPVVVAVISAGAGWYVAHALVGAMPAWLGVVVSALVCMVIFIALSAAFAPKLLRVFVQRMPPKIASPLLRWMDAFHFAM